MNLSWLAGEGSVRPHRYFKVGRDAPVGPEKTMTIIRDVWEPATVHSTVAPSNGMGPLLTTVLASSSTVLFYRPKAQLLALFASAMPTLLFTSAWADLSLMGF